MRLLSDRIEEFIEWMKNQTDFGSWDPNVQDQVHKKLIECMISDPPKKQHKWVFYMNGTYCSVCNASIGSDQECR